MQRVTGIGGVFFKARDAEGLRAWYRRHLGLDIQDWGGLALPAAAHAAGRQQVAAGRAYHLVHLPGRQRLLRRHARRAAS